MALTEILDLDIRAAQQQISRLEAQLNQLGQPVNVPVNVTGENELESVRRELGLADSAADNLNRELGQTETELRQAGTAAKRTGDDIESAGRRGGTAFGSLRGSVIGLVGAFGAVQAARGFLNFASDSIDAASDLEESLSKANVVFGDFSGQIEAFASTGPSALGLSTAAALEFSGTFGNLFVALGLTQQAATDLAPDIVQLGSDLASFNNIDVTEALDKLRAGLVGEAEPLRVLGVNLTAAATAAKAVELGLADSTAEVSEAAKVQARYALILEQTTTAQGDFERTADGIANSQRSLGAEFEDLQAKIGQALLPVFDTLLGTGEDLLPMLENLVPVFGFLGEVVGDVVDHLSAAGNLLGLVVDPIVAILGAAGGEADTTAFDGLSESARDLIDPLQEDLQLLERFKLFFDTGLSKSTFLGIFDQLSEELERGDDAIGAAERAFASFIEEGELTADILTAVAESAGLLDADMVNLFRSVAAGDFGALGPQELEEVLALIEQLRIQTAREFPPLSLIFGNEVDDIELPDVNADEVAAEIEAAAARAVQAAQELDAGISDLFGSLDITDQVTSVADVIGQLPTALEGAAEAMRDKEGEIRSDFSKFLDDLEGELSARQSFSEDIAALRDLNLDDLADAFVAEGLESAKLLADAVANPEEARRAEDLLDQYAVDQAGSFRETMAAELQQAFDLTVPLNITAVIQALDIRGLDFLAGQVERGARLGGNEPGGTPTPTPGNTVNQYFYTEPTPTPETARANQQAAAIVNVGNQS